MPSTFNTLFVCAKNQWRSPTAAAVYRNDARINVQSAGLRKQSPQVLSARLLEWADIVMVMENKHASRIRDLYRSMPELPEIIVLDIPDDYVFMDPALIEIIKEAVEPILEEQH